MSSTAPRRRFPRTGSSRSRTRRSRVSCSTPTIRSNCSFTHELAHVFHLDEARGGWRVLRRVFGRSELTFPHLFDGSYLIEGLATFYESRLTDGGRVRGARFPETLRAAVLETKGPQSGRGRIGSRRLADRSSLRVRQPLPRSSGRPIRGGDAARLDGATRGQLCVDRVSRSGRRRSLRRQEPVAGMERLDRGRTRRGVAAARPASSQLPRVWPRRRACVTWRTHRVSARLARWIAHRVPRDRRGPQAAGSVCRRSPGVRRAADCASGQPACVCVVARWPLDRVLAARRWWTTPACSATCTESRSHPARSRASRDRRVSRHRTFTRIGRTIVAVQYDNDRSRLVTVDVESGTIAPLTEFSTATAWGPARWSPDGTRLAAVRFTRGASLDLVLLSADGRLLSIADRRSRPRGGSGVGRERPGGNPAIVLHVRSHGSSRALRPRARRRWHPSSLSRRRESRPDSTR